MIIIEKNLLIEMIVKEVMSKLESQNPEKKPAADRERKLLIAGDKSKLRPEEKENSQLFPLSAYSKESGFCFDGMVILELSNAELCDISLGRDFSPLTCAVTNALLSQKPVYLYESALGFRKYKKTSAAKLYNVLENYVSTLEEYGVLIVGENSVSCAAKKTAECDECENFSEKKLITAALAEEICKSGKNGKNGKSGKTSYRFPKGTILTPSAKDFFRANKISVVLNGEEAKI